MPTISKSSIKKTVAKAKKIATATKKRNEVIKKVFVTEKK